jgi:hypothetical protein
MKNVLTHAQAHVDKTHDAMLSITIQFVVVLRVILVIHLLDVKLLRVRFFLFFLLHFGFHFLRKLFSSSCFQRQ